MSKVCAIISTIPQQHATAAAAVAVAQCLIIGLRHQRVHQCIVTQQQLLGHVMFSSIIQTETVAAAMHHSVVHRHMAHMEP